MPLPHILLLPLVPTPPDRTCSALFFSNFAKEKIMTFLFERATQGVSV
jgi:hypothetical protein